MYTEYTDIALVETAAALRQAGLDADADAMLAELHRRQDERLMAVKARMRDGKINSPMS